VPGKLDGVVPSPQSTLIDEIVPSGSVEVKLAVTVVPVRAGLGEMLPTVTVGGWSLTVSEAVPEPGPALFVAVTVMVKLLEF
jgi:hypothetical protein